MVRRDIEIAKAEFIRQENESAKQNPDYMEHRTLYMQKYMDGFMRALDLVFEKMGMNDTSSTEDISKT